MPLRRVNLVDDPRNNNVFTRTGEKSPEQFQNPSKACASIMTCGSAAGEVLRLCEKSNIRLMRSPQN